MKKILAVSFVLAFSYSLFAEEKSEVFLNGYKESIKVLILSIDKDNLSYKNNEGTAITIPMDQVISVKNLNITDSKFKKTVILTNKDYFSGAIIYQDRDKMTIDTGSYLRTINNVDIFDVVSESDFAYEQNRSPFKALGMSVVFPGVGQFYSNRYVSGTLFGSAFIASTVSSYYFFYSAQKDYRLYKDSSYVNVKYYNSYKKNMYYCYGLAGISASIYIWNLVDVYTGFSYKYDILNTALDKSTDTNISFNAKENREFVLAFNLTF